jgi:hypothetical protein
MRIPDNSQHFLRVIDASCVQTLQADSHGFDPVTLGSAIGSAETHLRAGASLNDAAFPLRPCRPALGSVLIRRFPLMRSESPTC